jgi:hypothetical protein
LVSHGEGITYCVLRTAENEVLIGAFGPRREEVTQTGENDLVRCFKICTLYFIILG